MDLITRLNAAHSLEVVSSGLSLSPFWERLWTIQEVALTPTILFHYGKEAFTTKDVLELCLVSLRLLRLLNGEESDSNRSILLGNDRAVSRLRRLRPLDDDWHSFGKLNLSTADYVRFARNSKSKDPKDKVFGLIALLPDPIAERIKPNYDPSFSIQETFVMFFKSCYEAAGNLDALARVIMQPSVTPNLPSWVLDLDSEKQHIVTVQEWAPYRFHKTNLGLPEKQLTFCENDRLLFCEGVIVDAVVSLGAVEISSSHVHLQAERAISKSRDAIPASNYDWKLALARVLVQDSFYEFSKSPSILNLRWSNLATGGNIEDWPSYHSSDYDRQFTKHVNDASLMLVFQYFFHGNEDFDIGGKSLRDYFASSTDTDCADPLDYQKMVCDVLYTAMSTRLFTTENGSLGTAPHYARLGDKIAVLSNCDMPMVLRPNGQHYEVVGSCFVEGLMKGEVAEAIEQGLYQTEKTNADVGLDRRALTYFLFYSIITERRSEGMVDELRELPQSE
ncbi:MAG: hypothetical protein Q9204_004275 [Flavoplaca sp. TL-2023a]